MITFEEIYTILRNEIIAHHPRATVTATLNPKFEKFPHVYIRGSHFQPVETMTLGNRQGYRNVTIEIHAYANTKPNCDKIIETVEDLLESEAFVERSILVEDEIDPTLWHVVGRWSRLIGDGDRLNTSIPTTNDEGDTE